MRPNWDRVKWVVENRDLVADLVEEEVALKDEIHFYCSLFYSRFLVKNRLEII